MSYPDYKTFLRYKNCCRPIGDTGPPGPAGPTGPAAILDVSGNKGEILYFSEDNTLDSTNTIFITNGNVSINNNLVVIGNLSMDDNFINDVSGIYFSDGTYIGHGSSFDITTSETLDISASGGISVTGDLTINDATTLNGNLNFKSNGYISSSGSSIAINTHRLTLDAATTINSNLSMDNNFINDVSGIYFTQGNLLFSDFSSVNQSVQLPSSQGQPISLERKTLFYQPSYNNQILSGNVHLIEFNKPLFNQLDLSFVGNIIKPSPDISGQFIELYANFDVSSEKQTTLEFDISGIVATSGTPFQQTIDVRSITKDNISFYLTFGPHIFIPSEWSNTTEFVFKLFNSGNFDVDINEYKLMFKSYFM